MAPPGTPVRLAAEADIHLGRIRCRRRRLDYYAWTRELRADHILTKVLFQVVNSVQPQPRVLGRPGFGCSPGDH